MAEPHCFIELRTGMRVLIEDRRPSSVLTKQTRPRKTGPRLLSGCFPLALAANLARTHVDQIVAPREAAQNLRAVGGDAGLSDLKG
jgi:hypothetical protein